MNALRSGGLLLLLGVLATAGCGTSPLAVQAVPTAPDSERYVSSPGTPFCTAYVWRSGVVNLTLPIHALVEQRNPANTCSAQQVAVYRGQRTGSSVTGTVVTWSNSYLPTTGSMDLSFSGDSLTGLVHTTVETPCGPATVTTSVVLVPEL